MTFSLGTIIRRLLGGPNLPPGTLHSGETVRASIGSLDHSFPQVLVATDRRILLVRTDPSGAILQLSQQTLSLLDHARHNDVHGRATITIEFHNGSTMRMQSADAAQAREFVTSLNRCCRSVMTPTAAVSELPKSNTQ